MEIIFGNKEEKMVPLRFDGRVVVITGAGAGLGRAYALLFGERGASVVVNDLGSGRHGEGANSKTADAVVEEIKSKGGKAVADYNSVTEGEKIIETALKAFGRIDIVVNNAGILRDKSFARISDSDWDLIHAVHVKGSFKTTQAAWPHFRKQNYGRIIMTSSNSGIYGNFGQANYSAAKMGLIGLANTLTIEGRKNNIHCNVIVPTAASRLTEDILPPDLFAELKPELIAPVVVWLCHEQCTDSGTIVEAAAGWATKCHMVRGVGSLLRDRISDLVTPEAVKNRWSKVTDMSRATHLDSIEEASGSLMSVLEEMKSNELITVGGRIANDAEGTYSITNKDCILYALGVGASVEDLSNLRYLYENHEEFSTLPTFAIIPGLMTLMSSGIFENAIPGHTVDFSKALHGEQYIELLKPFPTSGNVISHCKVADVMDKGKGAVLICDVDTCDDAGEKLAYGQVTVFVVGAGGFGGKRNSSNTKPTVDPPARQPDASVSQKTHCDQAAIYRLSGDLNPLHIDPNFSKVLGYSTPILHGLCSLGFSTRHVLSKYASNNPALCSAIKARFVKPVIPGETLKTDMWQERNRIHFQTTAVESENVVISGAYVDLKEVHAVPSVMPVSGNEEQLLSDAVFAGMKEIVDSNKERVKSINGVFVYHITKGGKVAAKWTLDLKKGQVYKGDPETGVIVDTTLTVDDQDMVDIALGKLNPQAAFMKGKLKIKGNIMLVQKLKILMSLESKL